jgi:hypothetical protein
LPNIVPVATGIVVGKEGVVSTAVTGTGVVTPIQIYILLTGTIQSCSVLYTNEATTSIVY